MNAADQDDRAVGRLTVTDLAGVVYSSGRVFDGLSTGRLDTENFLRTGSLDGVASRADLALLEDLRLVSAGDRVLLQVAAVDVIHHLDELHYAGGLVHTDVWQILAPANWGVRDLHCLEDLIPELIVPSSESTQHPVHTGSIRVAADI